MMNELLKLYESHQGNVSDKWLSYLNEYDRILYGYKNTAESLLEIGIQNGGSLEIWCKYFPKIKHVVGCDINPDCSKIKFDDSRIELFIGDANSQETSDRIFNKFSNFDIIIDDGSHTSDDIVKSFAKYFPRLNNGGLFIAEDLHCSYWSSFNGGLFHPLSSISFFKSLADIINHEHWGTKKTRNELINGFIKQYNIQIEEDVLASIHSLEFTNSACYIRKNFPVYNKLGERVISGCTENVIPGHGYVRGMQSEPPSQNENFWSILQENPPEVYRSMKLTIDLLKNKQEQLLKINQQIRVTKEESNRKLLEQIDVTTAELNKLRSLPIIKLMKKIKSGKNSIAHGIKLFYKLLIHTKNHGLFATFKKTVVYFKNKKLPIITNNSFENAQINYSNWINDHEDFSFEKKQKMRSEVDTWEKHPLISVIMPTYNPDVTWLIEAIDSVRNQIYPYWELCIADDASTDIQAKETLIRYSESDQRIKVIFRNSNGHISEASNTALENASGDWIAFLDQDDLVSPDALFHIAKNINNHIDALIIYSDEDKIDLKGQRTLPFFKPDWSPHLACQQAYLGHLVCINKTKTKNKICFDPTKNGAQDYDLWLQASLSEGKIIHIPHILYHWRMHQESTALNADSKPYADTAGLLAVTNYIKNKYPKADVTVSNGKHLFTYKLDFPVQEKLISVIIPTKDKIELLKPCINSIFEKSINNKYEIIIIDNNSFEEETFEYFSELKSQHSNVKIVTAPIAFNWSILNNIGRNNAVGDYLVFLNNDTEVITDDWLDRLTGYCALPDVAITGAVLKYPDGTIQHNGVVVGMGGWADHIYKSSAHMHCGAGPFISPALTRNTSAVTGACMAISTEKFDEIGGFDENFIICGSDVEICLRAMKNGYFNLVCSEVELYHYESKTRDTFIPEIDFEQSALKYEPYRTQLCDPFFNINLDKNSPNPKLK